MPMLPAPRGPVSRALLAALPGEPGSLGAVAVDAAPDGLTDDDLHLALYCCYELHYRGFDDVDERWEWDLDVLTLRAELEARFEAALVAELGPVNGPPVDHREMDLLLRAVGEADDAPSLSLHLARVGTRAQFEEVVMHRSAYQLKEADPHTWAIPRLAGGPKAALVEIQADEYGGGRPERLHARLFADTMEALGLDATYGAHLDRLPGTTLATVNLTSMLGLHRRLRGALVGHLSLYEIGSAVPSRRYAEGLRRLGVDDPQALEFYLEHVAADAVHEAVAAVDLAGGLARDEPALGAQVLWGARALVLVDGLMARQIWAAWEADRSSLRDAAVMAA
jgi:Iron-containing redox enzyme